MKKLILTVLIPLSLGGCLSFSSSPPPPNATVVVPPGSSVTCTKDGAVAPC